jgi:hypothetical protein
MKSALREFGLGKLALRLWHTPVGRIRDSYLAGGPWQQRRTASARLEMEEAAYRLPPVLSAASSVPPLRLYFLTGRKYWFQTLFCLWTLARHSGRTFAPVLQDDGSLSTEHVETIRRHFPAVTVCSLASALDRLHQNLPESRFPALHERWHHYPHIRKLIDLHAGTTGWKLVLDSDLLFFRRPDFLLHWLDQPDRPLHAVDCTTSYGYSTALLTELAGRSVPPLVNVGLAGLNSGELDWEKLEYWCRTLLGRESTSYYLEQALIALLVTGRECAVTPAADYITLPKQPEAMECRAVMHHYVAHSQRWYFQYNWKTALSA